MKIRAYLVYTWGGLHRYFGNKNHMPSEHRLAVHYFGQAYALDPAFRQARLARAILLARELNENNAALADLNALLREDPLYAEALFNRAIVYQQMGNYKLALVDLEGYLTLPDNEPYLEEAQHTAVLIRDLLAERP